MKKKNRTILLFDSPRPLDMYFFRPSICSSTSSDKKVRHWVFYGGIGPNIYFNNLVLAKDQVNVLNYFSWQDHCGSPNIG